jgi:diacylglycerol kinase family enzyme
MRVLLLHNPAAGDEEHGREALVEAFEEADHEVVYQSTRGKGWQDSLDASVDVFVAAGGDGTVRRVAIALAEKQSDRPRVPLAVLPLGTANNIAGTLGVTTSVEALAAGLERGWLTRLAVGVALGPWGEHRFVESAGIGVFAAMIRESRHVAARLALTGRLDERSARLAFGAEMLRQVLSEAEPMKVRLQADGKKLSGSYFLVEAMNITSIGPRVELAPDANHAGDFLDLVLAGEAERPLLESFFAWLGDSGADVSPITPRRVHQVSLSWPVGQGHLDDELWPDPEETEPSDSGTVSLEIETLLPLLIPAAC